MKRFFLVLTLGLLFLFSLSEIRAVEKNDVIVKVVFQSDVSGGNTKIAVLQIIDRKNNVLCYGFISGSDFGRTGSGGYPQTAIDCVPAPLLESH